MAFTEVSSKPDIHEWISTAIMNVVKDLKILRNFKLHLYCDYFITFPVLIFHNNFNFLIRFGDDSENINF